MSKRRREDDTSDLPSAKRNRDLVTGPVDRLSSLSDELLLNILSFLPVSSLNVCQTSVTPSSCSAADLNFSHQVVSSIPHS